MDNASKNAIQPTVSLIRAISAEFLKRKLSGLAIPGFVLSIVLLAGALWLTTVSAWWWLLAAPIIIMVIIFMALFFILRFLLRAYRPPMDKTQTANVSQFVDKLERVSEQFQTPVFVIIFRVVRDLVRPRGKSYVRSITEDSTTLHADFLALAAKFTDK